MNILIGKQQLPRLSWVYKSGGFLQKCGSLIVTHVNEINFWRVPLGTCMYMSTLSIVDAFMLSGREKSTQSFHVVRKREKMREGST